MPSTELKALQRKLQNLDYTRKRMEDLHRLRRIRKRDLDSVYEALFLRAVTSFESFVEELFIAILERRTKYHKSRKVVLRMTADSRESLMGIVYQNYDYLNWLPFDKTEGRARLYFLDGKPFTEIKDPDRTVIKTISTIRNAIAHKSHHSIQQFEKKVLGSRSLLRGERTPAGFLRSKVHSSGNAFEVYIGELGRIAVFLCLSRLP